ncbi:hypothetical protein DYB34_013419 [Aphanomyces astaci]|uniref:FYVE zinc finger domain-containing protein n=3 Tax=Aphanomyces astaci TaxID=112090 RepID=A0A418BA76_APHAT|nr:hypothetical protein DYB34_013419 [Aphanomyces astaci]
MATTVQGRRGWVRAYTSVDVDSCRPSANDRDDAGGRGGYVRGHHLCSGYVVMESTTKPGFLHVRLAMQCTFHAKDAASIKALAAKCQHLAALDLRLRSCRLSSNQPSNVKSMPLGVPATACGHCNKLFRLFTIKTTCQKCNQVL